ncbi:MAG: potassium transporter Kup [Myxococcales bacterium]|nr:potassium transporter Kup [Myxococcales bacterium]
MLRGLGALGIVYGDIGTSPLYALRECFGGHFGIALSSTNVYGVLSLTLWSLIFVISIKYLTLITRAHNAGEGGILALIALLFPSRESPRVYSAAWLLIVLGLFGAALLYGDGMITPAISVLSAVEGVAIDAPWMTPYVPPLTVLILVALFMIQHRGTARVGFLFGPVMLVWFVVLAVLGVHGILQHPRILNALNPVYAWVFFAHNGMHGFWVLGAVFLVVTGGEALYADMGHFGIHAIRRAWFWIVLPALALNYLGQGAILLVSPSSVTHPFFALAPLWGHYPLVVLSTMATVIASQAVITGSFSLTMQAVQLGYIPRLKVEHTSAKEYGQIYVPLINWILLLFSCALVVSFGTSSNLAAAYGVAVTTTMGITTLLFFFAMQRVLNWPSWVAWAVSALFLVADLSFFSANLAKVAQGGWFPLLVGLSILLVMTTWKTGRAILNSRLAEGSMSLEALWEQLERHPAPRVPGTAIYMYSNLGSAPPALLSNLRHNHVLHEQIAILTVTISAVPFVRPKNRLSYQRLKNNVLIMELRFGFMQRLDIPAALRRIDDTELRDALAEGVFVLGRETLLATERPGMAIWREQLFALMARNAQRATEFFCLPSERVLEIGTQVEL